MREGLEDLVVAQRRCEPDCHWSEADTANVVPESAGKLDMCLKLEIC